MKHWNRKRYQQDPEKVQAEWRKGHHRNREKRIERMRLRHERMKVQDNATNKAARTRRLSYYQEQDRLRWKGERREKLNVLRGEHTQKTRLASPWKTLLKAAAWRAKKKGLPFALTEEWAEERWTGLCEVSGLPFELGKRESGPKTYSPSIDQITPKAGYTPDNCRFVLWAVNALKHDGSDEDVYRIAKAITEKLQQNQILRG